MNRAASCLFLSVLAGSGANAFVSFDIDFSGAIANYDEMANSLVIDVQNVAIGTGAPAIDLRVESITPYFPRDDSPTGTATGLANNGTPSGTDDLRIHLGTGVATSFRFSFYDATVPGSFTDLYDPGENFAFRLVVYDLDGNSSLQGGADLLTINGPFSYATADTTSINVTQLGTASYLFDADGIGEVPGQSGIQDFTTGDGPNQLPISIYLEFNNISTFVFEYAVPNTPLGDGTGRNLLIDGNNISLGDFSPNPNLVFVPEPGFASYLFAFAVALLHLSKRRY